MEPLGKRPKRFSKIVLFSFSLGKQSLVERGIEKNFWAVFGEKIHLKKVPLEGRKPDEGYTNHRP